MAHRLAHNRLPTEVWGIIFSIFCLELRDYTFGSFRFEKRGSSSDNLFDAPTLKLSHVCSSWRQILRNSPPLWSSLLLDFDNMTCGISVPLSIYLKNSRDYPLIMHVAHADNEDFSKEMLDVWHDVAKYFPRCKKLTTTVDCFATLPQIKDLSFPNLESYTEQHSDEVDSLLGAPWLLEALCGPKAPKLTKAELWDIYPRFPYTQLTSLEIHCLTVTPAQLRPLIQVLPNCMALVSLTFCGMEESGSTPFTLEAEIPRLRRLSINGGNSVIYPDNEILSTLLTSFKLPALETFELQCVDWPPSLVPFIQRLTSSLKEVNIAISATSYEVDRPDYPLYTFLSGLPNGVKRLKMRLGWHILKIRTKGTGVTHSSKMVPVLLSKLSFDNGLIILPNLVSLSLWISDIRLDAQIVDRVLEMLSSRYVASKTNGGTFLTDFQLGHYLRPQGTLSETLPENVLRIRDFERAFGVNVAIGGITYLEDSFEKIRKWMSPGV